MGKRLLVLGASGQTGQNLIKQALQRDHHVTALVRDPTKIEIENENLDVAKCNIFDKEELKQHVEKADVVMSCLGFALAWSEPVPQFREISMNLSEVMKEFGKRRVIFMHSWYTNRDAWSTASFIMRNVFLRLVIGQVLAGMRLSEQFLETTDHLDYTCVLPAGLSNEPVTEKPFTVNDDGQSIVPGCPSMINRADVARYMLDVIDDESSYRKIRAIAVDGPVSK